MRIDSLVYAMQIPGLGGQLGDAVMSRLQVSTAGELASLDMHTVEAQFSGQGPYLLALASGEHSEPVQVYGMLTEFAEHVLPWW